MIILSADRIQTARRALTIMFSETDALHCSSMNHWQRSRCEKDFSSKMFSIVSLATRASLLTKERGRETEMSTWTDWLLTSSPSLLSCHLDGWCWNSVTWEFLRRKQACTICVLSTTSKHMLQGYRSTSLQKTNKRAGRRREGGNREIIHYRFSCFYFSSLSLPLSICVSASLMPIHLLDKWYCHDDREFLQTMIIELYASHKIDKQAEGNEREGERTNERDRQRKIAFPHRKRINRSPIMS